MTVKQRRLHEAEYIGLSTKFSSQTKRHLEFVSPLKLYLERKIN